MAYDPTQNKKNAASQPRLDSLIYFSNASCKAFS